MIDVVAQKIAVRGRMRSSLRTVAPSRLQQMCAALRSRVTGHPALKRARTIMLYAAVEEWREFETAALAEHLLGLGCALAMPRFQSVAAAPPAAAWIEDWHNDLLPGIGLVRRPRDGLREADPADIDAILIPGLAFDLQGRRLGRGGGFYDRFLPRLRPDAWRIGICWESQIVDEVPVEPHDQRVYTVVTEARLIDCGRP